MKTITSFIISKKYKSSLYTLGKIEVNSSENLPLRISEAE